jgi:hypothetical protein
MPKLPDRSIIRKLLKVLEVTDSHQKTSPRKLAEQIEAMRTIEFSFFIKTNRPGKHKLGYSAAPSIIPKIRLAIALGLLDEECSLLVLRKELSSELKATNLFSERAKDLLASQKVPLTVILEKSVDLLSKNPPQLPTAQKLYAECKTDDITFRWFRFCLSILLYEQDGALGASARRIYVPRSGQHQQPGEIGE